LKNIGTWTHVYYEAQYSAYTFPCQRFTGNVTITSAWLRADVGG